METIIGTIDSVEEKTTQTNKPFRKIKVLGKTFNVFSHDKHFKDIIIGAFITINYEKDEEGKYNNVRSIELATPTPEAVKSGNDAQRFSARQSALIRAVETLSNNIDPNDVLQYAKFFETYMMGEKELPPIFERIKQELKQPEKTDTNRLESHKQFIDEYNEMCTLFFDIFGNDSKAIEVLNKYKYMSPIEVKPEDHKAILKELQEIAYPDDDQPAEPTIPINKLTPDIMNRESISVMLNSKNLYTKKEINDSIAKAKNLEGKKLENYKEKLQIDWTERKENRAAGETLFTNPA